MTYNIKNYKFEQDNSNQISPKSNNLKWQFNPSNDKSLIYEFNQTFKPKIENKHLKDADLKKQPINLRKISIRESQKFDRRSITPQTFIHKNILNAKHSPRVKVKHEQLDYHLDDDYNFIQSSQGRNTTNCNNNKENEVDNTKERASQNYTYSRTEEEIKKKYIDDQYKYNKRYIGDNKDQVAYIKQSQFVEMTKESNQDNIGTILSTSMNSKRIREQGLFNQTYTSKFAPNTEFETISDIACTNSANINLTNLTYKDKQYSNPIMNITNNKFNMLNAICMTKPTEYINQLNEQLENNIIVNNNIVNDKTNANNMNNNNQNIFDNNNNDQDNNHCISEKQESNQNSYQKDSKLNSKLYNEISFESLDKFNTFNKNNLKDNQINKNNNANHSQDSDGNNQLQNNQQQNNQQQNNQYQDNYKDQNNSNNLNNVHRDKGQKNDDNIQDSLTLIEIKKNKNKFRAPSVPIPVKQIDKYGFKNPNYDSNNNNKISNQNDKLKNKYADVSPRAFQRLQVNTTDKVNDLLKKDEYKNILHKIKKDDQNKDNNDSKRNEKNSFKKDWYLHKTNKPNNIKDINNNSSLENELNLDDLTQGSQKDIRLSDYQIGANSELTRSLFKEISLSNDQERVFKADDNNKSIFKHLSKRSDFNPELLKTLENRFTNKFVYNSQNEFHKSKYMGLYVPVNEDNVNKLIKE